MKPQRIFLSALLTLVPSASALARESFDDLRFRSIGPAVMGGRIDAVAVVENRPSTFYVGAASGGLWKTENAGTTWTPLFDEQITSSIGDVAVAPSDPNVVWVGTGEPNNRQSSTWGHGVYRSTDGGRSFEHVGLEATHHIGKVVIDPRDPNRVFVAALGGLWGSNPERGVYRTEDGGKSWEKVLFVDEDTGVVTLVMDPLNADIVYAAAYQRRRTPWGFVGGGPGSGLYKTVDGGDTWRRLSRGLPEGPLGRIGLAVHRRDPSLVFTLIEHAEESGLYRSTDRGESFERINSLNPRPMYYSKVHVDPNDPERIYVLGSSFHVSDDGGHTFEVNRDMTPTYDVGVHGDHHALWIDPAMSDHLVLGGDGGLYVSWDRGVHWDKINNIPLAQFYDIAVDMDTPYRIYGGAQDTHSWGGPSATRHQIGILNEDWYQINFGDGMYQQVDPEDPSVVFTESQGGNIVRLDRRTGDRKAIKPYPEHPEGEYRFHWTSPFALSRHDPKVLYFGGNRLFVSRDRGDSWTASRDLTRSEDRDELEILGAVPNESTLSRHDGVSEWGTITTLDESPLDPAILWVGTDDGRIWKTEDGGETFESLEAHLSTLGIDTLRSKVSRVVASSAARERAYVSLDRHHLGDFAPYIFATEDLGQKWRRLDMGIDPVEVGWVNVVTEHPRNGGLLFVGAERGLFVSFDRGESWKRMGGGLPRVPIDDLVIHPRENDLVVGTHGRSLYILDDITALESHRPGVDAPELFEPRRAILFLPWKHESYGGQRQFVGENPRYGALLTYRLPRDLPDGVRLTIRTAEGESVRELEGPGKKGFQRIAWNLKAEPPADLEEEAGPRVPPGRYRVELVAGEERRESTLDVVLDPRLDISMTELRDRYGFLNRVNALRGRLARSVERTNELVEDSGRLEALLEGAEHQSAREALAAFIEEIENSRDPLGGGARDFRDPSISMRAWRLFQELSGNDVQQGSLHGPTPVQRARLAQLNQEADAAIQQHEALVATALQRVNGALEPLGRFRVGLGR